MRLLLSISFVLCFLVSNGQIPEQFIGVAGNRVVARGQFRSDSCFILPTHDTSGTANICGAIVFKNNNAYLFDCAKWLRIASTRYVDSLVAAGISGSGTANQLTYWTGTSTISGDPGLTVDAVTNKITADTVRAIKARLDTGFVSANLKVGTTGTSTAKIQSNTGTAFSSTPYLALGPLLSNSIYSTLHTSDTVTVANVVSVPFRAYQLNRNLVIGANGNIDIDNKNAASFNDIIRARDTITLAAAGHNNWYANSSQLNILKAGGYSGRSAIRGGTVGLSSGPNVFTAELVIAGSVGSNNFRLSGDWYSLVAELAHGASTQDTIDHYNSVWANSNYLGRVLKAEYFRGFGLGVSTDTLHSLYFSESNAMAYHEGNFGIGKRIPTRKLDVTGSGLFSDSVGIGTSSPLSLLDITGAAATTTTTSTTALGSTSGAQFEAYATAIPTAADQRLGAFLFGSRNGTGASNLTAGLRAYSNSTWTDNVNEQTYVTMSTTATNSLLEVMRWTANGRVSIGGTANPTASLHLKAGSAAAGNAPLKFTSGTNLTTAEAGAEEYNGTSRFFTPGSTRLRYVLTDNSIPSNGQIAIGNGTDYTVAALTNGNGITVTNGAGSISVAVNGTDITSGIYTPTLTNTTNISASTAYSCQYLKVFNTVTVSGQVDIDPIAGATLTVLTLSLPIAASVTNSNELAGTGANDDSIGNTARIKSNGAGAAVISYIPNTITNSSFSFSFTYRTN